MTTEHAQESPPDRRHFVTATVLTAGTMLAAAVTRRLAGANHSPGPPDAEDPLEAMRADLNRALGKPMEGRAWGMVIDTRKCIGCRACVVACVAENALPPGVAYRRVPEVEFGTYPDVRRIFMPSNCQHCAAPPCRDAAPAGAITTRSDGIVEFHYESLRDPAVARAVATACPYGAVSQDAGDTWSEGTPAAQPYETLESPDYGRRWDRARGGPPLRSARKCHFCLHKLERGELPACVTTCVGRAMYFGDFNDRASTVARLAATQPGLRHKAQRGTGPRVVYLTDQPATCQACHG